MRAFSLFPTPDPDPPAGIEELRKKREEVHVQILAEEEEKLKVQNDLHILTERLARLSESLNSKIATRDEYDRTIAETEGAYMKVRLQWGRRGCSEADTSQAHTAHTFITHIQCVEQGRHRS